MSEFTTSGASTKARQNWATVDDSDQEENERDNSQTIGSEECDTEEEDDDSSGDLKLDLTMIDTKTELPKDQQLRKEKPIVQLSKNQRKELREKELNDLDDILAQFCDQENPKNCDPLIILDSVDKCTEKSEEKKKKKKKKIPSKVSSDLTVDQNLKNEPVVVSDISQVLKSKLTKKVESKNSTISQAQKVAMEEALKVSSSKKKKRDKSKFCEGSY